ncbi:hypothetical protein [Oceanicoccus sp. KOV_DT_Chl]|uniref:hypothetical protein n=1 Tax=Oceanicoccus sp. KOV_DT_Chl TaxID=1904639 RepID=UPI000C7D5E0C|nr:hypothetical protein [Oceanicoccus sp. KOV_DT_Chl]
MSMSLYIILALEQIPSATDINSAAEKLSVPLEISVTDNLSSQSGFLPMKVSGSESGVEVYVYDASKLKDEIPPNSEVNFSTSIAFQFRWGGEMKEMIAAFYTAKVLMLTYNGVAFDSESGIYVSAEQISQGADAMSQMQE